jgi:hypothetical protein
MRLRARSRRTLGALAALVAAALGTAVAAAAPARPDVLLYANTRLTPLDDASVRKPGERADAPLFIGPQWGVYNTTRVTGFPSRFRPYANAVPTGSPRGAFPAADSLPVLLEVAPR